MSEDKSGENSSGNSAVASFSQLLTLAAKSDQGKVAIKNVGKALVTVTESVNLLLLPINALNKLAFRYFEGEFKTDLGEKVEKIPLENLIPPKPSIAMPALEGLAYSHEEPDLKEMYLQLLSKSMDDRNSNIVHPAFAEIIKQVSQEEAVFMKSILPMGGFLPIVNLAGDEAGVGGGRRIFHENVVEQSDGDSSRIDHSSMIDNFVRLGLITVNYTRQINDKDAYAWVYQGPHYKAVTLICQMENRSVVVITGSITVTGLGVKFAKSVGLI